MRPVLLDRLKVHFECFSTSCTPQRVIEQVCHCAWETPAVAGREKDSNYFRCDFDRVFLLSRIVVIIHDHSHNQSSAVQQCTQLYFFYKKKMTGFISIIAFVSCCASVFAHQQPYQPPPQQAYQQQVPHHHPQAGSVPQGHAPQGGVPQGHAPQGGVPQGQQANLLRDKTHVQDREHIKEHLQGVVNQPDVSKMSEEELQFHYFKMHDNDDNNKLDGCELIKSVLHWHVEESNAMGANAPEQGTTKIFQDNELSLMIDPILDMDDRNKDGFIDYPEFVNAQKSRGL
ncbi:multiple coagulation factor deficiency protein 2 [Caerostris darwini]|uniref:Multiple coagulation factor deficiency protein 2 n=1 Tax=Caerostris darwini TaxID=1538125 RepID=A0AAV4USZ7_9ARAC|nr:multiple coagulation factor deficiency protein 2 [Caerostris darwini]